MGRPGSAVFDPNMTPSAPSGGHPGTPVSAAQNHEHVGRCVKIMLLGRNFTKSRFQIQDTTFMNFLYEIAIFFFLLYSHRRASYASNRDKFAHKALRLVDFILGHDGHHIKNNFEIPIATWLV